METVTISKFKATCLELLKRVQRTGRPILITRRGEPIAEIVPPRLQPPSERRIGRLEGSGEILGDIVSPCGNEDWEVLST